MNKYLFLLLPIVSGCATTSVIDRDGIDSAIQAKRTEFASCYDREFPEKAKGSVGKVILAWVIESSGKPRDIKVSTSTLNNKNIELCLMEKLNLIQFPIPAGGVPVTVKYPFNFSHQ